MKDKSFEIKKIILGFILTTIVGTFLAFTAQYIHDIYSYKRTLLNTEKEKAQEHFENLSTLLDKRIYLTRKIYWTYEDSLNADAEEKRWKDYTEFLYEWNGQLNKNMALTERYFGEEKKIEFQEIHASLSGVGYFLQKVKNSNPRDTLSLQYTSENLDNINSMIYLFDVGLLDMIKEERIGVFIEKSGK